MTTTPFDEYLEVAEYYDHVTPYAERPDGAFYVAEAQAAGGPVLEMGCGTGRVLIPTTRAGVPITGLDASASMLAVCRRKVAAEPPEVQGRIQLVEGDMRDFDLGRTFRLITCPFRPFQHLITVEDQLACLHAAHRHLEPGGRLILDLFNPSLPRLTDDRYTSRPEVESEAMLPDGRRLTRSSLIHHRDLFEQFQDVELIYDVVHPDGRQEQYVHRFLMRYFFRYEAEHLLARAGFAVEALYADYDRSPYGSKYPGELIFVARK